MNKEKSRNGVAVAPRPHKMTTCAPMMVSQIQERNCNMEKKYFKELAGIIHFNSKYFPKGEVEDVASLFVEVYANGNKLPYANTPSAFIASEVDTLLDCIVNKHGRVKWSLKITSTGGEWEDEFDSYDEAVAEAKRCFEKSQINTFGVVVQEYDERRDYNVWENVSGSQYITDVKEVSDEDDE